MARFGEDLRREREIRKIALADVTAATKVSERHLLALEEERFADLPGGVLTKGIVRGYARACGLDEDAWVERYLTAHYESGQGRDDRSWIAFAENVGKARRGEEVPPGQGARWAGVMAMLALVAVFTWYVFGYVRVRIADLAPHHVPYVQTQVPDRG